MSTRYPAFSRTPETGERSVVADRVNSYDKKKKRPPPGGFRDLQERATCRAAWRVVSNPANLELRGKNRLSISRVCNPYGGALARSVAAKDLS